MKGYLLAATAVDGSMATEFRFTSVRVVCNNTLQMSLNKADATDANRVKVYHFENYDVEAVKKQLGVYSSAWDKFITEARELARVKIDASRAVKILRNVYEKPDLANSVVTDAEFIEGNKTARKVLELFTGNGIGAELATANGTAWGLVNATTEYYDHAANSRNADNRLHSAWFGAGAKAKQDVVDAIYTMV
jgi:phage/plasmid-like protein (TIGR03299 family)